MKRMISMFLATVMCFGLMTNALAAKVGDFSDVSDTAWYAAAVDYAYGNGLFSGTSASTFSPSNSMTRGMFATVLSRISGVDKAQIDNEQRFVDVDVNAYYGPSVTWAYENGIVSGVSATKFSPNSAITREQIAVMLYRYLTGLKFEVPKNIQTVSSFADAASVSDYAKEAVNAMRAWGFVTGDNNGNYNPRNYITRAEAATILMRVHYFLENGVPYVSSTTSTDTPAENPSTEVQSIAFGSSTYNITAGSSMSLMCNVYPAKYMTGITYESSNEKIAYVDTASGILYAESAGTVTITATSDNGCKDTCTVTVTDSKVPAASVTFNTTALSMVVGDTVNFKVSILPANTTDGIESVLSDNPAVAANNGLIVEARSAGTATLTVTTTSGLTAKCKITVAENAGSAVSVEEKANVRVGKTVQLHADVTPSSASKDVAWSSSDTHVATVDSNGVVTGVSIGTARITARTSDGKSDVCELTVTGIIPQGITVAKKNVTLPIGNTYKLACFITPSSAKNDGFSYSSSNPSVAAVAADGTVTAKAAGTAVITVKTMNSASKASAAVTITVSPDVVSVASVTLDQHDVQLSVKGTAQLTATVSPSNATDKSVMWSSDNTAVATVDSKGLVTAKSAGSAKITASAGGKSDVCLVTVAGEAQATSFSTTTPSFTIATSAYGEASQQEVGVIKFIDKELGLNDGQYMPDFADIGFKYTFVSSDPSVIKVNQSGGLYDPIRLKSGDAPRTATITVTREKDGATLKVDVTVSFNDKWMPIDDSYISRFTASVFKTVNQYRVDAGLQPLQYMYTAQDLANYRCKELAKEFSHARPDGAPRLIFTDSDGTEIELGLENIGFIKINYSDGATYNDPESLGESAAKNWFASEGHRDVMMTWTLKRTAVGLYVDTDGTAYMAQFFTSL